MKNFLSAFLTCCWSEKRLNELESSRLIRKHLFTNIPVRLVFYKYKCTAELCCEYVKEHCL